MGIVKGASKSTSRQLRERRVSHSMYTHIKLLVLIAPAWHSGNASHSYFDELRHEKIGGSIPSVGSDNHFDFFDHSTP